MARNSDRWVTPGVIVAALVVCGVVALAIIGGATWLVSIGLDPAPMLTAVGAIVTALTSLSAVALQLANRATTAKIERNTGVLAPGGVPDATAPLYGRHGRPGPPPGRGAAPAPPGS